METLLRNFLLCICASEKWKPGQFVCKIRLGSKVKSS